MPQLRPVPLLPEDAQWCLDMFGRLPVTHAVPLLSDSATDDEWLEARRTRIGASELAGIAGMPGAYGSWYAAWYAKTEGWVTEATMAMRIGHLLEPVVAHIAIEEKPWLGRLVRPGARLLAHPAMGWLCCTPDYLAIAEPTDDCVLPMLGTAVCCHRATDGSHQLGCQERGCAEHGDPVAVPVECKSDEGGQEWGPDMSQQAPLKYIAQNLVQADILGTPYGWLAHLAGKRFSLHLVDPVQHRDWYQSMVDDGGRFMSDLAAGCEPTLEDVDGSTATLEALQRRFPDTTDATEDHIRKAFLPGDLATQFRGSRRLLAEAREYKQLVDNRVRHVLGHAVEGLAPDGSTVVKRSIYARRAYRVGDSTVDQLSVVTR
jgi:predicted phage-related endonuclease